jgi:hypothetical protein
VTKEPAEVITHCPNPKCGKPIYSDHINSWCIECGEPLPDHVQVQIPELRALRARASVASSSPDGPSLEGLSSRALLERLVSLQEQQKATLEAIRRHTGCVYAWLILTALLGVLALLSGRL